MEIKINLKKICKGVLKFFEKFKNDALIKIEGHQDMIFAGAYKSVNAYINSEEIDKMVKDAEEHKAEDGKKKEEIKLKNKAEKIDFDTLLGVKTIAVRNYTKTIWIRKKSNGQLSVCHRNCLENVPGFWEEFEKAKKDIAEINKKKEENYDKSPLK